MNAILLLMGLLVLSYLGSLLVGGRTARGAGLPSGVEYVALGFVLGPHALDLVGGDTLQSFEPVVHVALGWLAFGVGLDFGYVRGRRVRLGSLLLGSVGALMTGSAVAASSWYVLQQRKVPGNAADNLLLAGGIGAACAETTRHVVRWVAERSRADGPLADCLDELAHADDLLPLFAVAVLFALRPGQPLVVPCPTLGWPLITVGIGVVLGGGAALLVGSELAFEDAWGVLFGVCLVTIGTTTRLALSVLTASFFLGVSTSALSRHSRELRAMVAPTERPVLLPALVLAGAHLDLGASPVLPWLAAAAVASRLVAKVAFGWLLGGVSAPARKAGPLVGLSLMSSGALAISIGLAFALRFPGAIGDTVLGVATVAATFGELIGPSRLRRALENAGEIEEEPGGTTGAPQQASP